MNLHEFSIRGRDTRIDTNPFSCRCGYKLMIRSSAVGTDVTFVSNDVLVPNWVQLVILDVTVFCSGQCQNFRIYYSLNLSVRIYQLLVG